MNELLYEKFLGCSGVSTDTRTVKKGDMFFALKGPSFDANKFAGEAIEKGASWAVIDNKEYNKDPRCIMVNDTLPVLQALAAYHRGKINIPVIAITGTNGKTTTKELISAVLSAKYRVTATAGNLNNHIGVPLTVLSITKDTAIAVIEMGANKPGDIRELCEIACPTAGLITNIGKAHIEGFGSFEGVLKTKTELYDYLRKHDGTVFINSSNPILNPMAGRFENAILYPAEGNYYHCELLKADPYITFAGENKDQVKTNLIGSYNFDNIAAALCVGKYFSVEGEPAHKSIADYKPTNMRSQVIIKGSNTIILDAYNANPGSMEAALKTLEQMNAKNKVAILGDMFELGGISIPEHEHIGRITAKSSINEIYLCGPSMIDAFKFNPSAKYFPGKESLEKFLAGKHFKNSVILIKASRGMQLETINKLID